MSEVSLRTGSGSERVLRIGAVVDRVVERSLLNALTPVIDPLLSPFAFGFRRGLGVKDAVAALARARDEGSTHVLRSDIAAAFDSVPRARAVQALSRLVPDRRVCDVVASLLARLDDYGLEGVGIAQGSAVSPLLLNLYLLPFDEALMANGFTPLRYADDIAVPAMSESQAQSAAQDVAHQLECLGLACSAPKTSIRSFDEGVHFLGVTLRARPSSTAPPPARSRPQRISMVVSEGGAVVRTRRGRVRVDRDGETVASMSLSRVARIVVQGRVGLTTPLLHEAAQRGIDVVMLSRSGGYVGRLSRRRPGDPSLRRAQARAYDSGADLERLTTAFVSGKITNMRVAVLRHQRGAGTSEEGARVAAQLAEARARASVMRSVPSLMGVEGAATRAYFGWLGSRVGEEWGFHGRARRPPPDPVNSMLSYGYVLLCAEGVSACEQAGLDPDMGFLHSDRWGRPSLALDLMEEWRPVIVDSTVLRIISNKRLKPSDFTFDAKQGARMTAHARQTFLREYEARMLTLAGSDAGAGRQPYRRLIATQAMRLAEALRTPGGPYRPYVWR
ncbi:CRISPR-associated endonuclease Cas1 [Cellulomonas bogoriensis]|uniref:CRISPR-associated endonuclease Cas1 n=1 Tax=Cellulomonas bogoriensis TaxID=301388 RepID=UPI0018DC8627|nr:CRISPR-associated endonuclease Cas1 [Cellulomonas bogoriensis]